jgi:hypothetical protein
VNGLLTDARHPPRLVQAPQRSHDRSKAILLICPDEAKPDEPPQSCCAALQRETALAGKGSALWGEPIRCSGESCSPHPRNARVAGVPFLISVTVGGAVSNSTERPSPERPAERRPTKTLTGPNQVCVERVIALGTGGQFDHCGFAQVFCWHALPLAPGRIGRTLSYRAYRACARNGP